MQLSYRGVKYEYNPPAVDVQESEMGGKYRGQIWRVQTLNKNAIQQANLELKYRGASYRTQPTTAEKAAQVPALSIQDKARSLMVAHTRTLRNRHDNMLSRFATAVGIVAHS